MPKRKDRGGPLFGVFVQLLAIPYSFLMGFATGLVLPLAAIGAVVAAIRLVTGMVPFLGEIPLHLDIRTTSDSGQPIVVAKPDSPHAQAYKNIAGRVWKQLTANQRGPRAAPRIVVR